MNKKLNVVQTTTCRGPSTAIVKIVGNRCNLRCRYCFYSGQDQRSGLTMSHDLLEKLVSGHLAMAEGRARFIWHGGEPLLAGRDFFGRILDLQANHGVGVKISNVIQTNATLIDARWASFLAENRFGVGVSVDGGSTSHGRHRLNVRGENSFDSVMRGVGCLREHGVEPGFIQTLTSSNLHRVDEDFRFFAEDIRAKSWGINVYLDAFDENRGMSGQSVTDEEFTAYLKRLFDLWLDADNPNLRIREIDNLLAGVLGKASGSCAFSGNCSSFFSVEPDGSVYPCDRLSGRPEYLFGSLAESGLGEILGSPARLAFVGATGDLHPDCLNCEWRYACNNGCTHHRQGGPSGAYRYCQTRKQLFSHIRERVQPLTKGAASVQ